MQKTRLISGAVLLSVALLAGACRLGFDLLRVDPDASASDDAGDLDGGETLDAGASDANEACATSICDDGLCCPEVGENNANCPQDCLALTSCGICSDSASSSCIGGDCDHSCNQVGCKYSVDCSAASDCRVECENGSDCDVECIGAIDCEVRCRDVGTTCVTDCTGATQCNGARCRDGAECLLDCSGSISCAYDDCEGGQTSCAEGIIACNRACP